MSSSSNSSSGFIVSPLDATMCAGHFLNFLFFQNKKFAPLFKQTNPYNAAIKNIIPSMCVPRDDSNTPSEIIPARNNIAITS
jgi:hypothetical protein